MNYSSIGPGLQPISALSLGSWNTFSRLRFGDTVDLIRRALDLGVNFFDVGYYWDKPHTEVIFGRALQVVGAQRSDYLLAEKLWLWDYPQQSFADQLKASLVCLGLAEVDLVMVSRPLPEMDFIAFCEEVIALIDAGLARAWGVTNWQPQEVLRAHQHFWRLGKPTPRLLQLQYNLARRAVVESQGYQQVFAETDVKLCAAHTLEGGILGGHIERDRVNPSEMAAGKVPHERNIARDAGGIRDKIRDNYPQLEQIARRFGATPAQLAIAFCMGHADVATTLVGVTRLANLEENLGAIELLGKAKELRAALAPLALEQVAHPRLFSPYKE